MSSAAACQLIGTGGRDQREDRRPDDARRHRHAGGGRRSRVIALISKPPAPAVAREGAGGTRLPEACNCVLLGRNEPPADEDGLQFARGTKEAALKAVLLTGKKKTT